jgi:formylglycine-generating enzyme required for sulfatase activity
MNCLDPQMEDSCCYGTSAVGIFPQGATPEGGVQDMAGNVVEWCLDIVERVVSDPEWADSEWHALRGGSWNYGPEFQDSVMRCSQAAEVWDCEYGFRVCR